MKTLHRWAPVRCIGTLALSAFAAAPALADTRVVEADAFTEIDAANGVRVVVAFGAAGPIVVDGDAIDNIKLSSHGGVLTVRPQGGGFLRPVNLSNVTVTVPVAALEGVEAANGAEVELQAVPEDAELRLRAVNGAEISAAGACARIDATASRGGLIDARDLDCVAAEADASMGGQVEISARESVEASASMGGIVDLYGDAEDVSLSSSMGGDVSRH